MLYLVTAYNFMLRSLYLIDSRPKWKIRILAPIAHINILLRILFILIFYIISHLIDINFWLMVSINLMVMSCTRPILIGIIFFICCAINFIFISNILLYIFVSGIIRNFVCTAILLCVLLSISVHISISATITLVMIILFSLFLIIILYMIMLNMRLFRLNLNIFIIILLRC